MSNKALNYVWENSKQTGSARVLMLAIADMANDDGECYPGNAKLTEKVLCSERNLQKLVDKCETDGELMVVEHGGIKTKNGWTNRYIIKGMSKKTPQEVNARTPRQKSRDVNGDTPRDVKLDVSRDVNGDTQNPQSNPQSNHKDIKRVPKPRAANPWYDAVKDVWDYTDALNGEIQKMLQGKSNRKGFKEYNLKVVIEPGDLIDWRDWYRETKLNGDKSINMLEERIKVQSSINGWVEAGKPKARHSNNGHKPTPITDDTPAANDDHIYNVRYFDPVDGSYIGTGKAAFEIYRQRGGV